MSAHTENAPQLRIPRSAQPVPTPTTHRSRRVPVAVYVVALVALVLVIVGGAQAAGWFRTTGQVATSATSTERVAPTTGAPTSDIKGWMTIQQVLDAYPVTKDALYAHFSIPAGTATSATLSEIKEAGTGTLDVPTLRTWIDEGAKP